MEYIYLDHAASTPLRPEVRAAMAEVEDEAPGNPSSPHRLGREARARLDGARRRVGHTLGVDPASVFFVRGGTESDNLALLGWARALRRTGVEPRLVHSTVEHSAVVGAAREVAEEGGQVHTFPVRASGSVGLDTLDAATRPQGTGSRAVPSPPTGRGVTDSPGGLVSCIWVSHECGLILPVEEVARWARSVGFQIHVDGVQGVGRLDHRPVLSQVDLFSISARKLGGPRGMGVLVVRPGTRIHPGLFGGGQEGGLRPGTEDVAGAVGTAVALEAAVGSGPTEGVRLGQLREVLETKLKEGIPDLAIHGAEGPRAPHILNVGIPGLPSDVLPGALDLAGVAVSAGSACRSGTTGPSPVISALYGPEYAASVAPLRISLGWNTQASQVEEAASTIIRIAADVRRAFG